MIISEEAYVMLLMEPSFKEFTRRDRYGVCWQIVPTVLGEMMKDRDRSRARRVAEAMLQMKKLDIQRLEKAYQDR